MSKHISFYNVDQERLNKASLIIIGGRANGKTLVIKEFYESYIENLKKLAEAYPLMVDECNRCIDQAQKIIDSFTYHDNDPTEVHQ